VSRSPAPGAAWSLGVSAMDGAPFGPIHQVMW
jgi:hypothetical protein